MKRLLKRKVEKSYLLLVGVVSIFLIVGYFSYAYFTVQTEKANVISIKAGTLVSSLTSTDSSFSGNKITVANGATKEIVIKLSNNNSQDAKFNFYYVGNLASGVAIGYKSGTTVPPSTSGVVISKGASQSYTIIIKNTSGSAQTITFGSDAGLSYNALTFPSNGHVFEEIKKEYVIPENTPLKKFINTKEYEESNDEEKKNMYVFEHEETKQQAGYSAEELMDYRYIGSDPNNYVTFNGENAGWRIIGIFTVENEKGVKEKRIKLIRTTPLEKSNGNQHISWDNKGMGKGSSEDSDGSSDWTDARLMMLLNPGYDTNSLASGGKGSLYWNQQSGQCPCDDSEETKPCDFTTTGLNAEARDMIGNTKWYLGGNNENSYKTTEEYYKIERGEETCTTTTSYCKNSKARSTFWIGKVGLIYPSDFGYAVGGTNRMNCLSYILESDWDSLSAKCYTNDWLRDESYWSMWTITPETSDKSTVYALNFDNAYLYPLYADAYGMEGGSYAIVVRPVVYLKSSVTLLRGTGTKSNPFVFE